MLVRTVLCLEGTRRGRAGLRAGVRLRPTPRRSGRWSTAAGTRPTRPARARRSGCRPTWRIGIEGDRVRARHMLQAGRACSTARSPGPRASPRRRTSTRRTHGSPRRTRSGATGCTRARPVDHRWRAADPALGAGDQGSHLHAHRRDGRGADHLAARDAGRRAQLGLPLHLDARLDVHAPGAALPQPGLGGRRVHAVRRRPRAERGRRAADHVRDRRAARPDRVDPRRAVRATPGAHPVRIGNGAFDQRQNDVFGAVLDSILLHTPPQPSACRGGCGRSCRPRRSARPRSGAIPTRASGRPAATRSTTCRRS